jgi:voltage-gated potassium channel
MRPPLARVRLGFVILAGVVLTSVCGYRLLGYDWIEAVWMVVVTISSVGFGERPTQSPATQLFTVGVILLGFSAAAYTFGGLLQVLLAGELEEIFGRQRMTREINQLDRHTIIVGFGRIGRILAADLARQEKPFVVIERQADRCRHAGERGYLYLLGNATDDDVLEAAGVARARSLISALPDDADNVFITLTARNLNRELAIVARAEHASSERKLQQAGANRVVMPSTIGAQQMSRMIIRPHTADLLELLAEQGNLNVEIDELKVVAESPLAGQTVGESQVHRQFNLLVLAVKEVAGTLALSPSADYRFQAGEIAIVLGKPADISRFRDAFRL